MLSCRLRFEPVDRDAAVESDGATGDSGMATSIPTLTNAEDEVFWDNGEEGETVVAEGTAFVDGRSTLYISADNVLDAGDIAQTTTFVSGTQLSFTVDRGGLPQGGMFLFVTNDVDLTDVDPELTSAALAVAVGRLWTPADAPGVVGWWDASNAATIFEATGDPAEAGDSVFRWEDLSGNGHHLDQIDASRPRTGIATVGSRALNGVDFNTSHELSTPHTAALALDGTGGVNMFAVVNSRGYVDRGSGLNVIVSKGLAATSNVAYAINMGATSPLSFKSGALSGFSAGPVQGQEVVISGVSNSSAPVTSVGVNGRVVGTVAAKGASDNGTAFRMGDDVAANDRHGDFTMGEFILLGGNLSADLIANFEGYLAHKWGIPLDSGHPYAAKFSAVVFD